jgi:hypothetical protein
MQVSALARRRVAICCSGFALVGGVAGCGAATTSSSTVSGNRLVVYSSVPTADKDVYNAEALALKQQGGKIGKTFTVVLKPQLVANTTAEISHNARVAISNKSTIAYLGEVVPGTTGTSLQITNQIGILEVSPTDNGLELRQSTAAVSGGRNHYYPSQSSEGYTFGSVVPSSAEEAQAIVNEMSAMNVAKVYVASDGEPYGAAMADAVKADVKSPMTVVSSPSGADAVFYGTNSVAAAVKEAGSVTGAKLFVPSALDTSAFASALPVSAQTSTYVSAPGTLSGAATTGATSFASAFQSAYGHAPSAQAIFGYEAMSELLTVLKHEGGNAGNRGDIVDKFSGLKQPGSATTPWQFVILRFKGGQLVPFKSVPATG